jgi:replicative DNA helicase
MEDVQILLDEANHLLTKSPTPPSSSIEPIPLAHCSPAALFSSPEIDGGSTTTAVDVVTSSGFFMDSKVVLYNGQVKLVYELTINDLLMGDDSRPRQLLKKTKVARENTELYRLKQNKGCPYILNKDNYITIKVSRLRPTETTTKVMNKDYTKNDCLDIRLSDYRSMSKRRQLDFKGYKTGVDFDHQPLCFDPYLFGLWIIDSATFTNEFTVMNIDILEECFNICQRYRMSFNYFRENKYAIIYDDDDKKDFNECVLRKLGLLDVVNKFIPLCYKANSRDNRLKLLAGIIDCEGTCNNNCVELTLKNELLAADIMFLCNSLGFFASKSSQKNRSTIRIVISGDLSIIPLINKKKVLTNRKQVKNVLHTGFEIEAVNDVNDCYELLVDGNGRFLLEDFTVVHC